MLNPNRGQSSSLYKENLKELNTYIDDFLTYKADQIEKEINDLNENIAINKNLGESGLNDILEDLEDTIKEYNKNKGLLYENQERIVVLNEYIDKLEAEIAELEAEIDSLKEAIRQEKSEDDPSESLISSYISQISRCREKISIKRNEIKEAENRIREAENLIVQLNYNLDNLKLLIQNLDDDYLKFLGEDGTYNYFEHKVAGFENGFEKDKFKEEIKKQIDIVLIMEINTLGRPDTKIKDEYVTVKYKDDRLTINSKILIEEVLNAYLDNITYNQFIVHEDEDILSYDRTISAFVTFTDEKAENPIYKDYFVTEIPYFYVNQVHSYYVIHDYIAILQKLLNIDNGYFKDIIEADGMNENDVLEYFENNMKENWIMSLGIEGYYGVNHFDEVENEVKNRNPEGQQEILSRAEYFMKSFNDSSLTYFPGQKLEGVFISDFINEIRIAISNYFNPVEKDLLNEVYNQLPGDYMLISDGEDKVWNYSNDIREELIIPDIGSEKKEITKVGSILSGQKSLGIGDLGFMQHVLNISTLTFRELYSQSIPLYSKNELEPGDLAFYYNPDSKEDGNIFGVYAGNNEFYHFNSYILYENNGDDVKIVKEPGDFNLFMRYYPINRGENND